MEVFGLVIPYWMSVVYIVGLFIIGLPMGIWSLDVWKSPHQSSTLGKMLFPISATMGQIGEDGHSLYETPWLIHLLDIHIALIVGNRFIINTYIAIQMIIWPLRLTYIILIHLLSFLLILVLLIFGLFVFIFSISLGAEMPKNKQYEK